MKTFKRIGVLTSGGDAPGMNAAVRAVTRLAIAKGVEVMGIYNGYQGLIDGEIKPLHARDVSYIINRGGTMLYTARSAEFRTAEGVAKAADVCRQNGIDGIVAIGGDGTFRGAVDLTDAGIPCIGIPGTIDNDIGCTHYSIGFDTAANTAIEAIDKLSDTMQSHERTSVVEVMGRHAGHLAVYVGLSVGATAILLPEKPFDFDRDVAEHIREGKYRGKHHHLIIVAEGVGDTLGISRRIEEELGLDTRVTIIGHVQRGGSPTARDRVMASRMGHFAIERFLAGEQNCIVCYRDSKLVSTPIEEALEMKKELDGYMYRVAQDISI